MSNIQQSFREKQKVKDKLRFRARRKRTYQTGVGSYTKIKKTEPHIESLKFTHTRGSADFNPFEGIIKYKEEKGLKEQLGERYAAYLREGKIHELTHRHHALENLTSRGNRELRRAWEVLRTKLAKEKKENLKEDKLKLHEAQEEFNRLMLRAGPEIKEILEKDLRDIEAWKELRQYANPGSEKMKVIDEQLKLHSTFPSELLDLNRKIKNITQRITENKEFLDYFGKLVEKKISKKDEALFNKTGFVDIRIKLQPATEAFAYYTDLKMVEEQFGRDSRLYHDVRKDIENSDFSGFTSNSKIFTDILNVDDLLSNLYENKKRVFSEEDIGNIILAFRKNSLNDLLGEKSDIKKTLKDKNKTEFVNHLITAKKNNVPLHLATAEWVRELNWKGKHMFADK